MDVALTLAIIAVMVLVGINFSGKKPSRKKRSAGYTKWIGGGLGWAFGGPIGGILGFVFGSMWDGMQTGEYEYQTTQTGDFSVSMLVLAAAVMKADGKVMRSELNYVRAFFENNFGKETAGDRIQFLKKVLEQEYDLHEVCTQVGRYMDYPSRLQLLHFLFGISAADGQYHAKEVDMIATISAFLGVDRSDYASIRAMFVRDTGSAYRVLEITQDATDDEVKAAYRKMAVKYHPDKVAHLGPDIQNSAKEKFQQLNAAYEEIRKQRGMK